MIMREGSIMLLCGIALGLLLAAATGKILSGIFYESWRTRSNRFYRRADVAGHRCTRRNLAARSSRGAIKPGRSASLRMRVRTAMLGEFWQDLRYGARMLLKSPTYTAMSIAALALSIASNTAVLVSVRS